MYISMLYVHFSLLECFFVFIYTYIRVYSYFSILGVFPFKIKDIKHNHPRLCLSMFIYF